MLLKKIPRFFIFLSLAAFVSCSGNQQQQLQGPPPVVAVTVTEVKDTMVTYYDEYPVTVNALNQVDLRAQVNGYITGIYFKDGDHVSKGQKLYSIDAQQYEANYQQAVANLAVQQTNLVKAQKDADRYHELDNQDAIAKQQVDYADAALEAAKKQVAAAEAAVRGVQTGVRYTTIYAPFDGTIGISQAKTGTPVSAGVTILNTVSSDNPVAADFSVDQKEIFRFEKMQQQPKNLKDSTFTLAFGNDVYEYPGYISFIDRAVDAQTGTMKIRLVFLNDKNMLKPGMTGTVRVLNNAGKQTILVPNKAVTEQLGEYFVYVVGDSSKVTQRKVATGRPLGANIIINSGLQQGEKIVVQGVQNLREGSVIKIDTAAAKK